ncbi:rubrerythrin-like domain-containing protein [Halogranum rubrum]|uniref:rubrerythrin-like domain-containing protein n=1 Tax=Halogranum rubrum TaxID=553466 RepID=UPI00067829A5|nr:rubrerythrin-like domain-containing protein [Halogranum salarium]
MAKNTATRSGSAKTNEETAMLPATETSMERMFTYECTECSSRIEAAHRPPMCESCGGEMQNISISREQ